MGNCQHKAHDAVVHKTNMKEEGDGVFRYDKDTKRIVYAGEDARTELMLTSSGSGSVSSPKVVGPNPAEDDDENNNAKEKSVLGEIAEFTEYLEDDTSTIHTQTTCGTRRNNNSPNPFLSPQPAKLTNSALLSPSAANDSLHPVLSVSSSHSPRYSVSPLAFENDMVPNKMDQSPQEDGIGKQQQSTSTFDRRFGIETRLSDDRTEESSSLNGIFHVPSEESDDLFPNTTCPSLAKMHKNDLGGVQSTEDLNSNLNTIGSDPADWDNDFFSAPSCSGDGSSQVTPRSWIQIDDLPDTISKNDGGNLNDSEIVLLDESVSSFEGIASSLQAADKKASAANDDEEDGLSGPEVVDPSTTKSTSSRDEEDDNETDRLLGVFNDDKSEGITYGLNADIDVGVDQVESDSDDDDTCGRLDAIVASLDKSEGTTHDVGGDQVESAGDDDDTSGRLDAIVASIEEENKEDKDEQKTSDHSNQVHVLEEEDGPKQMKADADFHHNIDITEQGSLEAENEEDKTLMNESREGFIPIEDTENPDDEVEADHSLKSGPLCADESENKTIDPLTGPETEQTKELEGDRNVRPEKDDQPTDEIVSTLSQSDSKEDVDNIENVEKMVDVRNEEGQDSISSQEGDTVIDEMYDNFSLSNTVNSDEVTSSEEMGFIPLPNKSGQMKKTNATEMKSVEGHESEDGPRNTSVRQIRHAEPREHLNDESTKMKRTEDMDDRDDRNNSSSCQGNDAEPHNRLNDEKSCDSREDTVRTNGSDEELAAIYDTFSFSNSCASESVTAEMRSASQPKTLSADVLNDDQGSENTDLPETDSVSNQSFDSASTPTAVEETGFIPLSSTSANNDTMSVSIKSVASSDDSLADYDPKAPFVLGATRRPDNLQESPNNDMSDVESAGANDDLLESPIVMKDQRSDIGISVQMDVINEVIPEDEAVNDTNEDISIDIVRGKDDRVSFSPQLVVNSYRDDLEATTSSHSQHNALNRFLSPSPSNRTVMSEGDISFDAERSQTDTSYGVSIGTGPTTIHDDDLSYDEGDGVALTSFEHDIGSKENESVHMNQDPLQNSSQESLFPSGFNKKVGRILESVEKQIKMNEKILQTKGVSLQDEISSYEAKSRDEHDEENPETQAIVANEEDTPFETVAEKSDNETECLVEEVTTLLSQQLVSSDDTNDLTACSSVETVAEPYDEIENSRAMASEIAAEMKAMVNEEKLEEAPAVTKAEMEDQEVKVFNKPQLEMTNLLTEDFDGESPLVSPMVGTVKASTVVSKAQGESIVPFQKATNEEVASLITDELENDIDDQESPLVTPVAVTALEKELYGMQAALRRKTKDAPLPPRINTLSVNKADLTTTTAAEITSLLTEHLDKNLDGGESSLVSPVVVLDENAEKSLDAESPLVSPAADGNEEMNSSDADPIKEKVVIPAAPQELHEDNQDNMQSKSSPKGQVVAIAKERKVSNNVQKEHVEFIRNRFSPRKPRPSSIPRARDSPIKSGRTYRGDRKSSIQAPSPKRTRAPAPKTPPRVRVSKKGSELTPPRSNAKITHVRTPPRSNTKYGANSNATNSGIRRKTVGVSPSVSRRNANTPESSSRGRSDTSKRVYRSTKTSSPHGSFTSPSSPTKPWDERNQSDGSTNTPTLGASPRCVPVKSYTSSRRTPGRRVKKVCAEKWDPYLFPVKAGCERCLDLASEKERNLFLEHGRHPRITRTSGGCNEFCTRYKGERFYDEKAPRLCRICFHATHRIVRQSKASDRDVSVPRRKLQAEYV